MKLLRSAGQVPQSVVNFVSAVMKRGPQRFIDRLPRRASQGDQVTKHVAGVDLMRLVPTTGPSCVCALVGGSLEPETDPYTQLAEWSPCADGQQAAEAIAREVFV